MQKANEVPCFPSIGCRAGERYVRDDERLPALYRYRAGVFARVDYDHTNVSTLRQANWVLNAQVPCSFSSSFRLTPSGKKSWTTSYRFVVPTQDHAIEPFSIESRLGATADVNLRGRLSDDGDRRGKRHKVDKRASRNPRTLTFPRQVRCHVRRPLRSPI